MSLTPDGVASVTLDAPDLAVFERLADGVDFARVAFLVLEAGFRAMAWSPL